MTRGYHYSDEVQQRSYDRTLMRRLMRFLNPYRKLLFAAVVLILITSLASSLRPYLMMRAVDDIINNPARVELRDAIDATGTPTPEQAAALAEQVEHDHGALLNLVLLLGTLMLTEMVFRYAQGLLVAYVGNRTLYDMRLRIFEHLQKMSLKFLDRNPVGRLMTRVTYDVEKIQQTIVNGVVRSISEIFTIVVVLVFMLWNNWRLALLTLTPVPFLFAASWIFRKYARRCYLEIRRKLAAMNAYLQENLAGIRVVQVFTREASAFEEYDRRNQEHRNEWFRQIRNYALYFPAIDILETLSTALVLLYIGYAIHGGGGVFNQAASVGAFYAYVEWARRLYRPVRGLADRYNMLLEAMASSERIFQLLDTPEDIENKPDAIPCERPAGEVEFRDVSFAYEPDQWVLQDFNLRIAPGECVAVVGHTGAGKTTLINLLSRFYDVLEGAILVDGTDIRYYEKDSLRQNIGIVLQDVFLFSGSVERNIRLGNESLPWEDIEACAEYVNAAKFIAKLPGGYEYDVGERGTNLSTGQRQLLAFARALAHDPAILVLDEATSSVDSETEALIQDAIAKLMADRTSIVIAHRLSTVKHADRIVVMRQGRIVETGTHQELLAKRGLYYRLYRLQYESGEAAS